MKQMKILAIALVAIFALETLAACEQKKVVELPLTYHDGYGPFSAAMGGIAPSPEDDRNPWYKAHIRATRLPEDLADVKSGTVTTDIYQFAYQNYFAGNITPEWYNQLQSSWNWKPDTLALSKTPVRVEILFAYGKDAGGAEKFVLDTNGNLDLSDDEQFTPVSSRDYWSVSNRDSMMLAHTIRAPFETFVNGKVVPDDALVFIAKSDDMYMVNFARYATTSYKGVKLAINSSNFTNLSFKDPMIGFILDDSAAKLDEDDIFSKDEYIEIKGEVLKVVGVDTGKNVLVLERTDAPRSELVSTQIGFVAHPFEGEEFTTHEPLSLDSLRGKYVFLDFWATWCGPCIGEFPNLKELYAKTDRERFEIVGIVGHSQPNTLTAAIEEHGVVWPQILSDDIVRAYGVTGFPTTLLLDPQGVIIARNLRGHELTEKVQELISN